MAPLGRIPHMAGDAAPTMKQFDRRDAETGIDLLPGEAERHRVVMLG